MSAGVHGTFAALNAPAPSLARWLLFVAVFAVLGAILTAWLLSAAFGPEAAVLLRAVGCCAVAGVIVTIGGEEFKGFDALTIGGHRLPADSLAARHEARVPDAFAPGRATFSASLKLEGADWQAFAALFPSKPAMVTIAGKDRRGQTFTEEVNAADITVEIARRGLPRAGQWGWRAREKRSRRLARAQSRRWGISRNMLVHGHKHATFWEDRAAWDRQEARALNRAERRAGLRREQAITIAPLMPEGATISWGLCSVRLGDVGKDEP